jgi:hypothetical protein
MCVDEGKRKNSLAVVFLDELLPPLPDPLCLGIVAPIARQGVANEVRHEVREVLRVIL